MLFPQPCVPLGTQHEKKITKTRQILYLTAQNLGFINISTNILSLTGQTKKCHCGLDPQSLNFQPIMGQARNDKTK